ncbi:hypothetical protein ACIQVR_37935 [Streptomyces xanthochromogenes]|uniref:hypothetical protein n=1 Tax=Streptomyces xanthochromogenes TaxID=67384 RepID=UPI00382B997E
MTEDVSSAAEPTSVPDPAIAAAIEKYASKGKTVAALGGALATALATGGQFVAGTGGTLMALSAPTVALLIPPAWLWAAERATEKRQDKNYAKTLAHLDACYADPAAPSAAKKKAQKSREEAMDAHTKRLMERQSMRSRWLDV